MKKITMILFITGTITLPLIGQPGFIGQSSDLASEQRLILAANDESANPAETGNKEAATETTTIQPAEEKKEESKFGFFVGLLIMIGSAILIIWKTKGIDK